MTQSSFPPIPYARAVAAARSDYRNALGTIIYPDWITGVIDSDSADFNTAGKVAVRVRETQDHDLLHDTGGFLDPYWDVEVVSDPEKILPDTLSFHWVFGPSYEFFMPRRRKQS